MTNLGATPLQASLVFAEMVSRAREDLSASTKKRVRSALSPIVQGLERADRDAARPMLTAAQSELERLASKLLKNTDSMFWLRLLRAQALAPHLKLDTGTSDISFETRITAEWLSGKYANARSAREMIILNDHNAGLIAHLLLLSEYYARLAEIRRHLAMGSTHVIKGGGFFNSSFINSTPESVHIFADRMASRLSPSAGVVGLETANTLNKSALTSAFPVRELFQPAPHPQWSQLQGSYWNPAWPSKFMLGSLDYSQIAPILLAAKDQLPRQQRQTIAHCLILLSRLASRIQKGGQWAQHLAMHGVTTEAVEDVIPDWQSACSFFAEHVLGEFLDPREVDMSLEGLLDSVEWSNQYCGTMGYGPFLRASGSAYIFDHAALGMQFEYHLNVAQEPGGILGSVRGTAFEENIQHVIDESPWKPSVTTRAFIGEHRPIQGRIFDIDAIGEHDGKLLIVEGKSIARTPAYDAAEGNKIYSTNLTIQKYERHFCEDENLRASGPTNRGLDVGSYHEVFGLLCIPGPLFLDGAACLSWVTLPNRIRRVCTIDELRSALNESN